ncbi:hypothetical protein EXIGLDRAFT_731947 [Exidia glandulosa HHB12029]|uniref:F-box domain-containing protein n=1 Tax=Exidia glandulosa HHB12029 TaxID=1314781 RepID=A0A165BQ05_EXIGL|nr:hypothetical protein EXIGLDRAFT_731947 [Exidia glandulosa HHB12029]
MDQLHRVATSAAQELERSDFLSLPTRRPTISVKIACNAQFLLRTMRTRSRTVNMQAPLAGLPRPALRRLLEHLDMVDRLALSCTCWSLRSAALAMPSLWTSVQYDTLREYLITRTEGRRMKRRGLMIQPPAFLGRVSTILALTGSHICNRLEVLDLNITGRSYRLGSAAESQDAMLYCHTTNPRPTEIDVLLPVLSSPAPELRKLVLAFGHHQWETRGGRHPVLRADLFAAHNSPYLLNARLARVAFPVGGCPALSYLTSLDYVPPGGTLLSSDLCVMLSHLPNLNVLGLTFYFFNVSAGADPCRLPPKVAVHVLQDLTELMHAGNYNSILTTRVAQLVDFFLNNGVMQLAVATPGMHDLASFVTATTTVRLECLVDAWTYVTREDDRVLHLQRSRALWLLLREQPFRSLVVLALPADFIARQPQPVLDAPVLRDLCFVVNYCGDCSSLPPDSNWDHNPRWDIWQLPWRCPSLRAVYVICPAFILRGRSALPSDHSYCVCSSGCLITLSDMRNFVSRCLIAGHRSRLDKLALSGIRFRDAEQIPSLRTVAEEVVIQEEDVFALRTMTSTVSDLEEHGPAALFDLLRSHDDNHWDAVPTMLDPKSSYWQESVQESRTHAW